MRDLIGFLSLAAAVAIGITLASATGLPLLIALLAIPPVMAGIVYSTQ